MGKDKRRKTSKYPKKELKEKTESKSVLKYLVFSLALAVAAALSLTVWMAAERAPSGISKISKATFSLPAAPRTPRPQTLSPALFQGKTAEAYRVAKELPELIERMPCYCGCYRTNGHQNNLDCYIDSHAAT